MLNFLLTELVLPLAVDAVKEYVKNTDSSKDDKVLEIVQEGAKYLAPKDNNSVSERTVHSLKTDVMFDRKYYQKSR